MTNKTPKYTMTNKTPISIVIPVFNEEDNVKSLIKELKREILAIGVPFEIIFVDDGSLDKTFSILEKEKKNTKEIKIIKFRRNFGQTAAMAAGFEMACGDLVITLDGDRQNDPKDIPKLIKKLEEGYDVVVGWRKNRKDKFVSRILPSIIANKIISYISGVFLHDYGCTLKIYRKEILNEIKLYGEMHRFIPAIAASIGATIAEIEVNHRARIKGKSKYGIGRTFKVLLDLFTVKFLTSYQTRPLHLFGGIGFVLCGIGGAVFSWLVIERIFLFTQLSTRPLFTVSIFFILAGIQLITIGLVVEMLVRTYYESQNKKPYVIHKVLQ